MRNIEKHQECIVWVSPNSLAAPTTLFRRRYHKVATHGTEGDRIPYLMDTMVLWAMHFPPRKEMPFQEAHLFYREPLNVHTYE